MAKLFPLSPLQGDEVSSTKEELRLHSSVSRVIVYLFTVNKFTLYDTQTGRED